MKTQILIASTTVLTMALTEVRAADGNYLHEACQSGSVVPVAYVTGVIDTVFSGMGAKPGFCASPRVTMKQLRDITCDWLKAHPSQRHQPGPLLITVALQEAYPC